MQLKNSNIDWVVSRDGQLAAFTRYIRENAKRIRLRQSHREYFQRVSEIEFLGRKWYGYGNAALLQLPVLEPMRYGVYQGAFEAAVELCLDYCGWASHGWIAESGGRLATALPHGAPFGQILTCNPALSPSPRGSIHAGFEPAGCREVPLPL